jgi:16S rRNA U516 pseudouridylate synthase RsuA-like enzyme
MFSRAMSRKEQPNEGIISFTVSNDEDEGTFVQPRLKKSRHERGSRMIVDSLHRATLMAAYHKYLSEYSNGRKHAIKQMIPAMGTHVRRLQGGASRQRD